VSITITDLLIASSLLIAIVEMRKMTWTILQYLAVTEEGRALTRSIYTRCSTHFGLHWSYSLLQICRVHSINRSNQLYRQKLNNPFPPTESQSVKYNRTPNPDILCVIIIIPHVQLARAVDRLYKWTIISNDSHSGLMLRQKLPNRQWGSPLSRSHAIFFAVDYRTGLFSIKI